MHKFTHRQLQQLAARGLKMPKSASAKKSEKKGGKRDDSLTPRPDSREFYEY